jgi:hypothetical protein
MDETIIDRIGQLPQGIQDYIFSMDFVQSTIAVWKAYLDNDKEKLEKFKDLLGLLFLKDVKIEEVPAQLAALFAFDEVRSKEAALLVYRDMLYPARDYFPGIDDAILGLGGELPAIQQRVVDGQFLRREEEMAELAAQQAAEAAEAAADVPVEDSSPTSCRSIRSWAR